MNFMSIESRATEPDEEPIHELPQWYITYCDLFVPADRCMYCWFGRGAAFHCGVGLICGLLIALIVSVVTAPNLSRDVPAVSPLKDSTSDAKSPADLSASLFSGSVLKIV